MGRATAVAGRTSRAPGRSGVRTRLNRDTDGQPIAAAGRPITVALRLGRRWVAGGAPVVGGPGPTRRRLGPGARGPTPGASGTRAPAPAQRAAQRSSTRWGRRASARAAGAGGRSRRAGEVRLGGDRRGPRDLRIIGHVDGEAKDLAPRLKPDRRLPVAVDRDRLRGPVDAVALPVQPVAHETASLPGGGVEPGGVGGCAGRVDVTVAATARCGAGSTGCKRTWAWTFCGVVVHSPSAKMA